MTDGQMLRSREAKGVATLWAIDPSHSSIEFAVPHLGIGVVKGRFTDFAGSVTLDEGNLARSSVVVEIDPRRVDTGQELRNHQLRGREFFDVQRFPCIEFRSWRVAAKARERMFVNGEVTIRGWTQGVLLDVVGRGRAVDEQGREREGFSATTTVDRRDFGLVWNLDLPGGGQLLGNEVTISVELELVRSPGYPDVA